MCWFAYVHLDGLDKTQTILFRDNQPSAEPIHTPQRCAQIVPGALWLIVLPQLASALGSGHSPVGDGQIRKETLDAQRYADLAPVDTDLEAACEPEPIAAPFSRSCVWPNAAAS